MWVRPTYVNLPLNVVIFDKPNMLTGLNQTVCGEEWPLCSRPSWTNSPPAKRKRSDPLGDLCETG